mmetsp:Transcript_1223/g.1862  ORF Transcript_1223/g.1862 Transcript_1223/m.1862 type:complete len:238 (-) Transcript_1223:163-876(-)|eukprot:CAMPEP_0195527754 /NCGR_PEP_ID=MMETSP0794_2-20130614/29661_1 /TAXON_ID=515487 /ORGANISM="Stephanopyxis turris, Strain CCMP 815" /LENGTH=237 /DNA_ID=CAMNT_0040658743 /DNA_START=152 /DNA_END=865 /DNA_ORIENTATION=+
MVQSQESSAQTGKTNRRVKRSPLGGTTKSRKRPSSQPKPGETPITVHTRNVDLDTTIYNIIYPNSKKSYRPGPNSWRKHGHIKRMALIQMEEKLNGNNSSLAAGLHSKFQELFSIQLYYAMGDKLLSKFCSAIRPESSEETFTSNHDSAFIYGRRLLIFQTETLPTHPSYYSPAHEYKELRHKQKSDVKKICACMLELIENMDRVEFNKCRYKEMEKMMMDTTEKKEGGNLVWSHRV